MCISTGCDVWGEKNTGWSCSGVINAVFLLHHNQVCCVEFDRKDINMNKLVATSLEGKFHVFDMRTQHPTKGFASVSEKVIDLR